MLLNSESGLKNMNAIRKILDDVPLLFRKFTAEDLRNFLSIGHIEYYSQGDVIVRETDESSHTAYLIADGKLTVWNKNIHLADMHVGDFLGEPFLYNKSKRSATVKVESDSVVIRFDREETLQFFRSQPERLFKTFIMNIMEIQHGKIISMNSKLVKLKQQLLYKDNTGNS